jgi:ribosomal protein S20
LKRADIKSRESEGELNRQIRQEIAQGQIASQAQGRAVQLQLAQLKLNEAGTRRDAKALQDIGPALRNIAVNYPDGTANNLIGASSDDKKKIQGAYRAIEESEQAADFIARNPKAVGALAKLRNVIKIDAIKSLKSDDEAQTVAGKSAIVESQIDDAAKRGIVTKDEAEAAKILEKRLFGLALADVQGSGQRGSVYLDRQFQNLYDQASRPDTLLKVIKERSGENNRNLKVYRLGVERHDNPNSFPLTLSETGSEFNKYIRDRSPGPTQQDRDFARKNPALRNKFIETFGQEP